MSGYGNYLNLIALSLFAYDVTGTAFGVGAVMALRLFSGFLAGLTAGALSARVARRTSMICADVAQAAAMTVLALCVSRMPLWLLACVVMVLGAGNTFFTVALRSAVPVMVGQDARSHANGLLVTARSFATVLGFASAAPVIGLGGYTAAFAVNAASFMVSATVLLVLRPRTDEVGTGNSEEDAEPDGRRSAGPLLSRSCRIRIRHATAGVPALLMGMILLRGVDALASSSHNVALPVVAHSTTPSSPAVLMTQFWVAWAIGTLVAHQVLKRRRDAAAWGERMFAVATCLMSLSFVVAFAGLPTPALIVAAASAGFADGCTEIIYTSRLQAAPDLQRSRLFGWSATAEQSGFALGTVAAAAALEVLPALTVVAAFHGAAVCGALALLVTATRRGTAAPLSSTSKEDGEDAHGTRTGADPLPRA
ncbi:MFS transporter [Streptomyces sp. NPDC088554]|uniref:MFS transporter n=1 Tax=Streptomyces sp. NPDC088554 TaxID=3365865 RepID=UPI00381BD34D